MTAVLFWMAAAYARSQPFESFGDPWPVEEECDDAEEFQVQLLQRRVQVLPNQTAVANETLQAEAGSGNLKTLYHMTTPSAGNAILHSAFRPGHTGWCGGGIYFAVSPYDCWHKAVGPLKNHTAEVFMIEAVVDLGRMKTMPYYCTSPSYCTMYTVSFCGIDKQSRGSSFQAEGYDSLTFNPGDGQEFVIFEGSRVRSMKRIPWPPAAPPVPSYVPYYPYYYR